jgi:hypothetical protein
MQFAENSLFLTISNLLATFDISIGENGGKGLEADYLEGTVTYLKPFECVIRPRGEGAVQLIRDSVE